MLGSLYAQFRGSDGLSLHLLLVNSSEQCGLISWALVKAYGVRKVWVFNSLMRPSCSVQVFLTYFGFLEIKVAVGIFDLSCFDIVLYS